MQNLPGGPARSRWPLVFGIIATIFGALTLLMLLLAPLGMKSNENNIRQLEAQGVELPDNYLEEFKSTTVIVSVGNAFLAAILLTGGILLVKRKKMASPVLQGWSVLKIFVGGYLAYLNYKVSSILTTKAIAGAAGGDPSAEQFTEFFSSMMGVGYICGFIWLGALPVILLIWLNRKPIKDDIASWSGQAA
ncbi:MAG: DUF4064 domain-containing protein [Verrucomicrobiales bacterium]|nr:DUF4064 domain-containing protein [Verrucomicrobiales bacterium]